LRELSRRATANWSIKSRASFRGGYDDVIARLGTGPSLLADQYDRVVPVRKKARAISGQAIETKENQYEKEDAVGSVHLAINNLVSALHGIRTASPMPDEPLTIELGEDRVFILQDGLVVCRPHNFMNVDAIPFGDLTAAIKVIPYPPRDEGSSSGSGGESGGSRQTHNPETGSGGERQCPICLGTGKIK